MSNNDDKRIIYDMRANAKNFFNLGIDIETISKGTGLIIEEIKNIELEE